MWHTCLSFDMVTLWMEHIHIHTVLRFTVVLRGDTHVCRHRYCTHTVYDFHVTPALPGRFVKTMTLNRSKL